MLSRTFARRAFNAPLRRQYVTIKPGCENEIRPAFNYPADPAAGKAFINHEKQVEAHAGQTGKFWGKVCLFIVVPAIVVTAYHSYVVEEKHIKHFDEHPRLPDSELPPDYDYQNVRKNKFFWGDGDKTLFWSDKFNHKKGE